MQSGSKRNERENEDSSIMKTALSIPRTALALLVLGVSTSLDMAQLPGDPSLGGAQSGRSEGAAAKRRLPPVFLALDTNRSGAIEANEITNATASLKTLLKPGGKTLTLTDLMGNWSGRAVGSRGLTNGNSGRGGAGGALPGVRDGSGSPGGPGGPGDQTGPSIPVISNVVPRYDDGGKLGELRQVPPVFSALDSNHDGLIDADEIAQAPAALASLLRPGNTTLLLEDLVGPSPTQHGGGGNVQNKPGSGSQSPPDKQPN